MITIAYANEYGEPITPDQLSSLSDYNKLIKEDGVLRIIECYMDNHLGGIEFYKHDGITISEIFERLNTNTVTVVELDPVIGNYSAHKKTTFKEGIIKHIKMSLYLNSSVVCEQAIDVATNSPILNSTIKYLYDNYAIKNEIGDEKFNFRYNSDGSLRRMGGERPYFNEYDDSMDATEIAIRFPNLLIEHPYYAEANFLP